MLNNTRYLEDNLYPIIDYFLDNSNEDSIKLQVSIFSSWKDSDIPWKDVMYKKIADKYGDKIILSIFKIKSDEFHDRVILTNNLWIECGAGFDLFKKEDYDLIATKITTLHIASPFFSDTNPSWCLSAYQNTIGHILEILPVMKKYNDDIKNEFTYWNIYIGIKENRIYLGQDY